MCLYIYIFPCVCATTTELNYLFIQLKKIGKSKPVAFSCILPSVRISWGWVVPIHDINPCHLGICQCPSTYENHPGGYITEQLSLSKSYRQPSGHNKFISAALQTTNTVRSTLSKKTRRQFYVCAFSYFSSSDLISRLYVQTDRSTSLNGLLVLLHLLGLDDFNLYHQLQAEQRASWPE